MSESHVPATIVRWSARTGAEAVDEKLLLALDTVFAAMRPEWSPTAPPPQTYQASTIVSSTLVLPTIPMSPIQ